MQEFSTQVIEFFRPDSSLSQTQKAEQSKDMMDRFAATNGHLHIFLTHIKLHSFQKEFLHFSSTIEGLAFEDLRDSFGQIDVSLKEGVLGVSGLETEKRRESKEAEMSKPTVSSDVSNTSLRLHRPSILSSS